MGGRGSSSLSVKGATKNARGGAKLSVSQLLMTPEMELAEIDARLKVLKE